MLMVNIDYRPGGKGRPSSCASHFQTLLIVSSLPSTQSTHRGIGLVVVTSREERSLRRINLAVRSIQLVASFPTRQYHSIEDPALWGVCPGFGGRTSSVGPR